MDDSYAARRRIIPPLPWQTFSPPFSLGDKHLQPPGSVSRDADHLPHQSGHDVDFARDAHDSGGPHFAPFGHPETPEQGSRSQPWPPATCQTISDYLGSRSDGRYGSGRPAGHGKVEHCRSLDINRLRRDGCLEPSYWGGRQWTRDGERVAWIGLQMRSEGLHLNYRVRMDGDE